MAPAIWRALRPWILAVIALLGAWLDASAQTTAIRFGRLWDGMRVVDKPLVIVERDRIVRVTTGDDVPAGATVIDLARYTGTIGNISGVLWVNGRPVLGPRSSTRAATRTPRIP